YFAPPVFSAWDRPDGYITQTGREMPFWVTGPRHVYEDPVDITRRRIFAASADVKHVLFFREYSGGFPGGLLGGRLMEWAGGEIRDVGVDGNGDVQHVALNEGGTNAHETYITRTVPGTISAD